MTSTVRATGALCLALDIGGTKIEAAVISADGAIRVRQRIATRAAAPELFDEVAQLLVEVRFGHDVEVLGVGCGGPMRRSGTAVSPLNIPAWREFNLLDALRERTGLPVFIDNDAKALALAEGRFGGAVGMANYLSMVVSTGVGGGLVIDGRLVDGRDGNAGHIGHVHVEPRGRLCACGARGCLEAEVSGAAIAAITGDHPADAPLAIRERCGDLVGQAVSSAAALLDFDHCFVGGSVALGYGDDFFKAANAAVRRDARIAHARTLSIVPTALDTRGSLLGAAVVAWRSFARD